jgi:hypothetical protein
VNAKLEEEEQLLPCIHVAAAVKSENHACLFSSAFISILQSNNTASHQICKMRHGDVSTVLGEIPLSSFSSQIEDRSDHSSL